jgi:hypothetical protein
MMNDAATKGRLVIQRTAAINKSKTSGDRENASRGR